MPLKKASGVLIKRYILMIVHEDSMRPTLENFAPRFLSLIVSFGLLAAVAACGPVDREASYPTDRPKGSDQPLYTDQKAQTIWGPEDTLTTKLFGGGKGKDSGGAGIGVNSFLWSAALNTISFMPVVSADPFGGVILTDWYENPETPGQRFKLNVYILDKQLRADGIRVAVFKQTLEKGLWRDDKVPDKMSDTIENIILTRARELRVAQLGVAKK
jgi:hypothetical protein